MEPGTLLNHIEVWNNLVFGIVASAAITALQGSVLAHALGQLTVFRKPSAFVFIYHRPINNKSRFQNECV